MNRTLSLVAVALVAGTLSLAAQMGLAHVELKNAEGKSVGTAMIMDAKGGGVRIAIDFKDLPRGEHALHFHQIAKCEPPFTTAGGHFNPEMKKHGMENPEGPHAGDMANFTVTANGTAKATITNTKVSMGTGANSLYASGGTALMIHATADDMKSDPAGNAGARIACGTVVK